MANGPTWASPLAPPGEWGEKSRGPLLRGLLTTFDPPDPSVLVEDLLPSWFDMDRAEADEGPERDRFYSDLYQRLVRLRGRLVVFASPREADDPAHWLWSCVRRLFVGRDRRMVQHAKLWMLHRAPVEDGPETLEVVVGSTNLTRDALRGQIQAAWKAWLPLVARPTRENRRAWRVLSEFLRELGRAAGEAGSEAVSAWLEEVLPRASYPPGISFLASVPGFHTAKTLRRDSTAWGLAAFRTLRVPGRLRIAAMIPTVGAFTPASFAAFVRGVSVDPRSVTLAWIGRDDDRTAWKSHWVLPRSSASALVKAGARFVALPPPGDRRWSFVFHPDYVADGDPRWYHGKVYWLRGGRRALALVTSANLSLAAWGRAKGGGLEIENFELGVAFAVDGVPLDRLDALDPPFHTTRSATYEGEAGIAWADATWDGRVIIIECRLAIQASHPSPSAAVITARGRTKIRARWRRINAVFTAHCPWVADHSQPLAICVRSEGPPAMERHVPVTDLRPTKLVLEGDVPPLKLARHEREVLELKLLEEKYGLGEADDDGDRQSAPPMNNPTRREAGERPSYGIATIEAARLRLRVVQAWADLQTQAHADLQDGLRADGERLAILWDRLGARRGDGAERLAARVAAVELRARLAAWH